MKALDLLLERGLSIEADGDRLWVGPADRLDDELRDLIRQHKPELLDAVRAWSALEAAINACCDARRDTDENRRALLADCRNEPADRWPWFRWYFEQEASRWTH